MRAKYRGCLFVLYVVAFVLSPIASARHKQTPEQKNFIIDYLKYLERSGGWGVTMVATSGKDGDILDILMPSVPVAGVYMFVSKCIDSDPEIRKRMKSAGYRLIRIETGVQSVTFPKGDAIFKVDQQPSGQPPSNFSGSLK